MKGPRSARKSGLQPPLPEFRVRNPEEPVCIAERLELSAPDVIRKAVYFELVLGELGLEDVA
jgi:hypothetical protein